MIGALRDWFFPLMLLVSLLLHGSVFLYAWLVGSEFQPPQALTPQQGKVSVQLRASVDARPRPTVPPKQPPKQLPPEPTPEVEVDPSEPLPIVPEPQPFLAPSPQPAELPRREVPPVPKQTAPVASVASPASKASEGAVDQLPTESVNPAPDYPDAARAAGIQGTVWVRLTVDATGKVTAARVQESSGYEVLDDAALRTVRRWVFRPARRDGKAVSAQVDKPFEFSIRRY